MKKIAILEFYFGSFLLDASNVRIDKDNRVLQFHCDSNMFDLFMETNGTAGLSASINVDDVQFDFSLSNATVLEMEEDGGKKYHYAINYFSSSNIRHLFRQDDMSLRTIPSLLDTLRKMDEHLAKKENKTLKQKNENKVKKTSYDWILLIGFAYSMILFLFIVCLFILNFDLYPLLFPVSIQCIFLHFSKENSKNSWMKSGMVQIAIANIVLILFYVLFNPR